MSKQKVLSWADVPASTIVSCLGEKGDGFHPRNIIRPEVLNQNWGIPYELLPVDEYVANEREEGTHVALFAPDGTRIGAMQGVVIGHLIDAIAVGLKPLGFAPPRDLQPGYSGSRFQIAKAIVDFLTIGEGVNTAIWTDGEVMESMHAIRNAINECERVGSDEDVDLNDIADIECRLFQSMSEFQLATKVFRERQRKTG